MDSLGHSSDNARTNWFVEPNRSEHLQVPARTPHLSEGGDKHAVWLSYDPHPAADSKINHHPLEGSPPVTNNFLVDGKLGWIEAPLPLVTNDWRSAHDRWATALGEGGEVLQEHLGKTVCLGIM